MAKSITAYVDAKGHLHTTHRAATLSDIANLFGSSEGMAMGIAATVLDKRKALEEIFAALDDEKSA